MNKRMVSGFFVVVALLATWLYSPTIVHAESCESIACNRDTQDNDSYLSCIKQKQDCWKGKIDEAQQEATSLKSTISILNGQISLQELKITQTESELQKLQSEVIELEERIGGLSLSLDRLSTILIERIQAQYKQNRIPAGAFFLNTDSFTEMLTQYKYLTLAQQQTASAMERAESQRLDYDRQKSLKEEKQQEVEEKKQELEQQKGVIAVQRREQQYLLSETQNNEARFQSELAKALAEGQAIQSIIAGKGDETEVRSVQEGETIATIIPGASVCSSGTHLHFEVVKDGYHRDPAGYLHSTDVTWDNAPDGSFGFGGSWRWPVNSAAIITQGYGMTYYARVKRIYGGSPHTGMDMVSKNRSDLSVKAVKPGTLYRGSIRCGGGLLRYVKVKHEDDTSTLYLHINY